MEHLPCGPASLPLFRAVITIFIVVLGLLFSWRAFKEGKPWLALAILAATAVVARAFLWVC